MHMRPISILSSFAALALMASSAAGATDSLAFGLKDPGPWPDDAGAPSIHHGHRHTGGQQKSTAGYEQRRINAKLARKARRITRLNDPGNERRRTSRALRKGFREYQMYFGNGSMQDARNG